MHELSVAQNLVEIVGEHILPGELPLVRKVRLRVGEGAGIMTESLDFCFREVVAGTPLRHAFLEMERVPLGVRCRACGAAARQPEGLAICPVCGSREVQVIAGCELDVVSIEMEG